jgi:hypothetical protein
MSLCGACCQHSSQTQRGSVDMCEFIELIPYVLSHYARFTLGKDHESASICGY